MLPIRVFYEDTDCGGVVYYANYFSYFERGRSEFLGERGGYLTDCHGKRVSFVIARAELEYFSPTRYDDLLLLETQLTEMSRFTMTFRHAITRKGSETELVKSTVTFASVNNKGKAIRLPDDIRRVLGAC